MRPEYATESSQFGPPEITAGTLADAATIKLPKRMPYRVAMELLLTGRWMKADEAHRWGLVNEVLADEKALMNRVWEVARLLESGPPWSSRRSRRPPGRPRACRSRSSWKPGDRAHPRDRRHALRLRGRRRGVQGFRREARPRVEGPLTGGQICAAHRPAGSQEGRRRLRHPRGGCSPRPTTRPRRAPGALSGGRRYSYYDGVYATSASSLDIDHVVPLAEAWDSGARSWTADRRECYANDLTDTRTLVGLTASLNHSKGDQDVAEWMPPINHGRYIKDWVAVKIRWGLSMDSAEKSALESEAADCTNSTITVTVKSG